ncbi:LemA family protein [Candidatus Xianfuyuplasma coldseepsis]|uniref:LemA family protein n=1 Tax=Candidatus Xianfuyuplasma coldseepsis TaxID=2782163 RepID=A0A7L7KNL3_9MOLU|nr:LemA family protein [Xianfuyuplasma coldseepsis]QMS84330.1 LemA family protein [Xianfuyuplasma coldseepsis]
MNWLWDLLIIVVLAAIVWVIIVYQRKRLLRLWNEVTKDEVAFYRQLEKVHRLFYEHLDLVKTEDNLECVRMVRRYRKKRIRSLLLNTRQDLYNSINLLYDEVDEHDEPEYIIMKEEYDNLQKIRRIYNSKVLIYNQTISVFPTRYLALRMNLELKEYFG